MKWSAKLLKKLLPLSPEWITGKSQEYEKEMYRLYGKGETENQKIIQELKEENVKRYLYLFIMLAVLLLTVGLKEVMAKDGPILTNSKGQAYIERPLEPESSTRAELVVEGTIDHVKIKKPVNLTIKSQGTNERARQAQEKANESKITKEEFATKSLSSTIYMINKEDSGKRVYLPTKIEGLNQLSWNIKKNNPIPILLFGGVILFSIIYFSRYERLKRLQKSCGQSIQQDLPEFLNKLVLLMNAGLVLTSAFGRTISDYNDACHSKKSYFYEQLIEINKRVAETNAPITEELKRFAERSGNREFMRVANVIWDNIHKGTELVTILQNESNFLWFQRKKQAEERGRIAETRLTLPLALQLVVLIMITLAPAILDM